MVEHLVDGFFQRHPVLDELENVLRDDVQIDARVTERISDRVHRFTELVGDLVDGIVGKLWTSSTTPSTVSVTPVGGDVDDDEPPLDELLPEPFEGDEEPFPASGRNAFEPGAALVESASSTPDDPAGCDAEPFELSDERSRSLLPGTPLAGDAPRPSNAKTRTPAPIAEPRQRTAFLAVVFFCEFVVSGIAKPPRHPIGIGPVTGG